MSDFYGWTKHPINIDNTKIIGVPKEYDSLRELVDQERIDYAVLRWYWSKDVSLNMDTCGNLNVDVVGEKTEIDPEYSFIGEVKSELFDNWLEDYSCADSYSYADKCTIYELPNGKRLLASEVLEYDSDSYDDDVDADNLCELSTNGTVIHIDGENYIFYN